MKYLKMLMLTLLVTQMVEAGILKGGIKDESHSVVRAKGAWGCKALKFRTIVI